LIIYLIHDYVRHFCLKKWYYVNMGRITYKKGSLFTEPKGKYLAQATNCRGSFGSGIALKFKKLYPDATELYRQHCVKVKDSALGTTFIAPSIHDDVKMVCLFTSRGYGKFVDSPPMIEKSTQRAIEDFLTQIDAKSGKPLEVHSNKFNSGLFRVPWTTTEAIIENFLTIYPNLQWIVWTWDGK